MRTRHIAATALVALCCIASGCVVAAQAMEPVGDVVDHPLPAASASSEDALEHAVPEEHMQSLFNWAIENSDPARLREMAEETKMGGGAVGVGDNDGEGDGDGAASVPSPTESPKTKATLPPKKQPTQAELLAKRADVKEALALLSANPTEQQFIQQATGMFADPTRSVRDRLLALEEMEELVRPLDNANDLRALNVLAPLIAAAVDVSGDTPDVVSAAALGVLAIASSNNPKVTDHIHSWRVCDDQADSEYEKYKAHGKVYGVENIPCASGSESTAFASVASRVARIATGESTPAPSSARRSKALRALSALTRNHFPSRRAFFAANGERWMRTLFQSDDEALRKRAFALAQDFWQTPDVAGGPPEKGFPKGRQDEEVRLAEDSVGVLADAMTVGSADAREKAFFALEAALDRLESDPTRNTNLHKNHAVTKQAAEGLANMVQYFEQEAASAPETATHALEIAGRARRVLGKMSGLMGGGGREEL